MCLINMYDDSFDEIKSYVKDMCTQHREIPEEIIDLVQEELEDPDVVGVELIDAYDDDYQMSVIVCRQNDTAL